MKTLPLLATITLLCAGCQHITVPTESGPAVVRSFGQRTKISELSYDNGTLSLKGYNNDQVTGMVEAFKAGMAAGAKAVVP